MNIPSIPPPESPESEGGDGTHVALVSTLERVNMRVCTIDDDRVPEGMVCMGSFIDDRLIARSAVTPEMITDIEQRDYFSDPVRVALAAVEQPPGLQCRLFALLPAEQFEQETEDEPWTESVPKYEDTVEEEKTTEAVVPLLLGHIVRFSRDRKHPENLAAEAADILQTIITDQKPLGNVVDKILDDLLDS